MKTRTKCLRLTVHATNWTEVRELKARMPREREREREMQQVPF